MIYKDDRTPEELKTHTFIVLATDKFMSGWGQAKNGVSYAGWACRPEDVDAVETRIRARKEMIRVRVVKGNYRPSGRARGHCHIYVEKGR